VEFTTSDSLSHQDHQYFREVPRQTDFREIVVLVLEEAGHEIEAGTRERIRSHRAVTIPNLATLFEQEKTTVN
jgi:hypothetical protein